MSDEEKKAIEILKDREYDFDELYCTFRQSFIKPYDKSIGIILNLIKKQSKEIERTNEILIWKQKHEEQLQKEIEELKEYKHDAELTKVACCTAQHCEALNNCIKLERELQNADNKWEDKIKAKIEELENEKEKYFEKQVIQHEIEILQSLLEKE